MAAIDGVLSLGYNNLEGARLRRAILQTTRMLCLYVVFRLEDRTSLLKEMPRAKIDVNQLGQLFHTLLIR